jgi:hypothetical protein
MIDRPGQSGPEVARGGDDRLWAVVATIDRIVRIAEIYSNQSLALADRGWREQQVKAYFGFLQRTSQPIPRYSVRPVQRSQIPRSWRPLPALGFLNGNLF